MIDVKIEIPKELPVKQLNQYIDDVVFNIARMTLDLTNTGEHFPKKSGDLQEASMAEGVVKQGKATYYLGARGVNYAPAVWKYPQKSTNWTNPNTYAQWYEKQYKTSKELIMEKSVSFAKKGQRL